jgi:hypothetical protein
VGRNVFGDNIVINAVMPRKRRRNCPRRRMRRKNDAALQRVVRNDIMREQVAAAFAGLIADRDPQSCAIEVAFVGISVFNALGPTHEDWPRQRIRVSNLFLDPENIRLQVEVKSPQQSLINDLFLNEKAIVAFILFLAVFIGIPYLLYQYYGPYKRDVGSETDYVCFNQSCGYFAPSDYSVNSAGTCLTFSNSGSPIEQCGGTIEITKYPPESFWSWLEQQVSPSSTNEGSNAGG